MIRLNSKLAKSEIHNKEGVYMYTQLYVWCPGCDDLHGVVTSKDLASSVPCWVWDGNEERPTFSPSIRVTYGNVARPNNICHSFIRNGVWEFLHDCHHAWAGKNHDMIDLPDWVGKEE